MAPLHYLHWPLKLLLPTKTMEMMGLTEIMNDACMGLTEMIDWALSIISKGPSNAS